MKKNEEGQVRMLNINLPSPSSSLFNASFTKSRSNRSRSNFEISRSRKRPRSSLSHLTTTSPSSRQINKQVDYFHHLSELPPPSRSLPFYSSPPSHPLLSPRFLFYSYLDDDDDGNLLSVTALLSVPSRFLLHDAVSIVPSAPTSDIPTTLSKGVQNNPRGNGTKINLPLLSGGEASVLLRVSLLAYELDSLFSVACSALQRLSEIRTLSLSKCNIASSFSASTAINRNAMNDVSVPQILQPALGVHSSAARDVLVNHVSVNIATVMDEMNGLSEMLKEFAYQNWSLAEQLDDALEFAFGGGGIDGGSGGGSSGGAYLGERKRCVAEVEEAVCVRIDKVLEMASSLEIAVLTPSSKIAKTNNIKTGKGVKKEVKVEQRSSDDDSINASRDEEESDDDDAYDYATDNETGKFLSMEELCDRLLYRLRDRVEIKVDDNKNMKNDDSVNSNMSKGGMVLHEDIDHNNIKHIATGNIVKAMESSVELRREGNSHVHSAPTAESVDDAAVTMLVLKTMKNG